MRVGIMQPYFLPYLGYWQLMKDVDIFVVYDNIQYTKKGWINRNRYCVNGNPKYFTLPLKKDSDFLDVKERYLTDDFKGESILNLLKGAYGKAPEWKQVCPLLEQCLKQKEKNLFQYIYNGIELVKDELKIDTKLVISSQIDMDHTLKGKDRVIEICKQLGADTYVNPIGGTELYDQEEFRRNGLDLYFLKSDLPEYPQFTEEFVPALSIADVMMFNSKEQIQEQLKAYHLVSGE